MLTKIYLEGPLGENFGREWELDVCSPSEAIQLIDANSPGLINWVRAHANKYTHYQVVVQYGDSKTEELNDETYAKRREVSVIRFVPVISGSGKWTNAVVGAVLLVVGYFTNNTAMMQRGAIMLFTGTVTALLTKTANVRLSSGNSPDSKVLVSEVFDGPTNTTYQGIPISLIYGRILTGSQAISAGIVINQVK